MTLKYGTSERLDHKTFRMATDPITSPVTTLFAIFIINLYCTYIGYMGQETRLTRKPVRTWRQKEYLSEIEPWDL
jgi:hypothetical protein